MTKSELEHSQEGVCAQDFLSIVHRLLQEYKMLTYTTASQLSVLRQTLMVQPLTYSHSVLSSQSVLSLLDMIMYGGLFLSRHDHVLIFGGVKFWVLLTLPTSHQHRVTQFHFPSPLKVELSHPTLLSIKVNPSQSRPLKALLSHTHIQVK